MNAPFPRTRLGPLEVCVDPAREPCFTVAKDGSGMIEFADGLSPDARRERLHRHMNNEIGSMEMAAQSLVDFPDAPWELRMQLARQTNDESRHVEGLLQRLEAVGGYKGEFPVSNYEWTVTIVQDTLVARLALQNRTFEAGQMDLLGTLRKQWRDAGDIVTADLLDAILADEVNHVRFANRWIRQLAQQDPRVLLKVAMAVRFLADANAISGGGGSGEAAFEKHVRMGVNVDDRRNAEFSDAEINEILRQHGMTALAELAGARA
jgi:bacterioferritin (cytochrome b1)